ncbi:MAG: alpha/beta hydrolase [Salinivenus sp.]
MDTRTKDLNSEELTTRSADGTRIGALKLGSGPPLVIVHGGLVTGEEYLPIAEQLADHFTCHLMDRRGGGRSGDADAYSIDREREDVEAVLDVAGPEAYLLGHSWGATVALEAARRRDPAGLVLYEPPLPVKGPAHQKAIEICRAAVEKNQPAEGLAAFFRDIVGVSGEQLSEIQETPLWGKMVSLTPRVIREMEAVDGLAPSLERYREVTAPTLLLVGSLTTQDHLAGASRELEGTLPNARIAMLEGEAHMANLTSPDQVAREVAAFLLELRSET